MADVIEPTLLEKNTQSNRRKRVIQKIRFNFLISQYLMFIQMCIIFRIIILASRWSHQTKKQERCLRTPLTSQNQIPLTTYPPSMSKSQGHEREKRNIKNKKRRTKNYIGTIRSNSRKNTIEWRGCLMMKPNRTTKMMINQCQRRRSTGRKKKVHIVWLFRQIPEGICTQGKCSWCLSKKIRR